MTATDPGEPGELRVSACRDAIPSSVKHGGGRSAKGAHHQLVSLIMVAT